MTRYHIFVIRAILGLIFAVVLIRMFYGGTPVPAVIGLTVFLVGMSYVTEYFRQRKRMKKDAKPPMKQ